MNLSKLKTKEEIDKELDIESRLSNIPDANQLNEEIQGMILERTPPQEVSLIKDNNIFDNIAYRASLEPIDRVTQRLIGVGAGAPKPDDKGLLQSFGYKGNLVELADKGINLLGALERVPSAYMAYMGDIHKQGILANKTNKNPYGVDFHEAMTNAFKGDPSKPYGDVQFVDGYNNMFYGANKYNALKIAMNEKFKDKPLLKLAYDPFVVGSEIGVGLLTDGWIIKGTKFMLPSLRASIKLKKGIPSAIAELATDKKVMDDLAQELVKKNNLRQRFSAADDELKKLERLASEKTKLNKLEDESKAILKQNKADTFTRNELGYISKRKSDIDVEINAGKDQAFRTIDDFSQEIRSVVKEAFDRVDDRAEQLKAFKTIIPEPTGAEGDAVKLINKAYDDLKKSIKADDDALSTMKIEIDNLQSARKKLNAVEQAMRLSDDFENHIKDSIKRVTYLEDFNANMIKNKNTGTGWLARKHVDATAKAFSGNRVTKLSELNTEELETIHEVFLATKNLPQDMKVISNLANLVTPEWLLYRKFGLPRLYSRVDDAFSEMVRWGNRFDKMVNNSKRTYRSRFHKKFGNDEEELLSYFADEGNDTINVPAELLAKFNDDQINYIKSVRNDVKKFMDFSADEAIRLGYMTRDTKPLEQYKYALQSYTQQLDNLEKSMSGLDKKSTEFYAAQGKAKELKKLKKEMADNIRDYPAVYVENYFPHVKSIKGRLLEDISKMKEENYMKQTGRKMAKSDREWSDDVGTLYSKAFRKNMPTKVNATEFMKRVDDGTAFSRRATDVMSGAFRAEMKKIYLEPALQEGKSFISALPVNGYTNKVYEAFDRLIRKTRGMEMFGDQTLNKWFYSISREVEKISGGRIQSRARAWDDFAGGLRQMAMRGTILGNMRVATKNLIQSTHTVVTIGPTATYAGWESMFTNGGKRLLKQYNVMINRMPLEAFDITNKSSWDMLDRIGGSVNQAIETFINCSAAGNGAVYRIMTSDQSQMNKLAKYAMQKNIDPKAIKGHRFWDVMADAVEDGLFRDVITNANNNIKFSQWSYHRHDMSPLLSSSTGKLLGMFTNWPSHFFTAFVPQLWRQLTKGEAAWGGHLKWTDYERYGIFSYATMVGGIYYMGTQYGFDMSWMLPPAQVPSGRLAGKTVPFPVSPPVAAGYDLVTAGYMETFGRLNNAAMLNDQDGMSEALRRFISYDIPSMTPMGVGTRNVIRVAAPDSAVGKILGVKEQEPESLFMPQLNSKKKKVSYSSGRSRRKR